jgi:hypothetical protein
MKVAVMANSVGSGMLEWLRSNPAPAGTNPPMEKFEVFPGPDGLQKMKVSQHLLISWF